MAAQQILNEYGVDSQVDQVQRSTQSESGSVPSSGTTTPQNEKEKEKSGAGTPRADIEHGGISIARGQDISLSEQEMVDVARGEIVVAPTFKEGLHVLFSMQTLFHGATYFCSFGGELAINSYLGAYYLRNFPELGQTGSGRWASMFGLLNIITR